MNDFAFVAAGNTTRDPHLRKFTYDAENKQTKVETVNSSGAVTGTIGEYFYDGDGRRVKKIAYSNNQVTETTVFVYNASSRLVAEYSTILNPTPQVAYLTNDHLGSPRINTNENGKVTARHDYRPYGEEVAERTHAQYVGDTIRKQFTQYERDNETDLDFAQARYFCSSSGRFSTPDPLGASANPARPQSWHRYIYSYNNPLRFTDPTGMIAGDYVDEDGKRIGSDGINDQNLYFVVDKSEQETVRKNDRAKQFTIHSALDSELELPEQNVRTAIGVDAVAEAKRLGGYRETGGQVIETANGQLAVPAVPGPVGTPGENGGAEIDKFNPADPTMMKQSTGRIPLTTYHIHPPGTKTKATGSDTGIVMGFDQQPSPTDITNASNQPTKLGYHIQVGAGRSTIMYFGKEKINPGGQMVQFYNGNDVIGSMTLKGFINAGRR